MSNQELAKVSNAEWEIMRVVWAHENTTSRNVHNILNKKRNWENTTVKTLLKRLVDKKLLGTKKEGNKFIYFPLVEEKDRITSRLEELLEKVCSQKCGMLIQILIEKSSLSFQDIETLQQVLNKKKETAEHTVLCNCEKGQCENHILH